MQIALWISASISVVALRPARNQPVDQVVGYRASPCPPNGEQPGIGPRRRHREVGCRRGRRISAAALDGYSGCSLEEGGGKVRTVAVVEPTVDQKGRNHCQ